MVLSFARETFHHRFINALCRSSSTVEFTFNLCKIADEHKVNCPQEVSAKSKSRSDRIQKVITGLLNVSAIMAVISYI